MWRCGYGDFSQRINKNSLGINHMHNYFWSYVLAAIGLVLLVMMIPKYRQQLTKSKLPLEQRYAKEIANGDAVIIPRDPAALKKLIFMIACSGIFVVLFQKFKTYISSLEQTCTDVAGWNSLFVYLGGISIVGSIVLIIAIMSMYRDYQEIIKDGYAPPRTSKQFQNRMAFKLTKRLKIKEQLRMVVLVIGCILFISMPFQIIHILVNISPTKPISIYELNDHLQKSCLDGLKKDSSQHK